MTTDDVVNYGALANRLARVPWIEIVRAGKPLNLEAIEKQVILWAVEILRWRSPQGRPAAGDGGNYHLPQAEEVAGNPMKWYKGARRSL